MLGFDQNIWNLVISQHKMIFKKEILTQKMVDVHFFNAKPLSIFFFLQPHGWQNHTNHQINKSFFKAPSHQSRFVYAFVCSSESFRLRRVGLSLESDAHWAVGKSQKCSHLAELIFILNLSLSVHSSSSIFQWDCLYLQQRQLWLMEAIH